MDIGPYTLRELIDMVQARRREDQEHTAQVMAAIFNSRQGVKKSQFVNYERLNPYKKKPKRSGDKMTVSDFARGWGK